MTEPNTLADVVNAGGIIWAVAVVLFMLALAALSRTKPPKYEDDRPIRMPRR